MTLPARPPATTVAATPVIVARPRSGASRGGVRAVAGVLADGTPHYAPVGVVLVDGDHVLCHLCGHWYRSVLSHLPRSHGWNQTGYRAAFGLERSQPLEGAGTRARRAAALAHRRTHDPAVRAGCAVGRRLAASGELTRAAAAAARGRPQPAQRRRKTLATLAATSPAARAAGSRRFADARLRATANTAAARLGFADIGALVADRLARGASLAATSREAGLHKDWLSRHLVRVHPRAAEAAAHRTTDRADARWLPTVRAHGFTDVAGYLTDRHLRRHRTVSAIGAELGLSRSAVATALRRHGIARTAHASARAGCAARAEAVAARFGFADVADYLADRRHAGHSWRAIAAECGQPQTWVRRRAGRA